MTKKAPLGWRFGGAGLAACGVLGVLLYIHSGELAYLVQGIVFIGIGAGMLFAPFYAGETDGEV
ncbi:MAG: hypothetical protein JSV90_00795 [Methanobacteriota archaeon]|nr:MAG: hypothetical protein JSV90_00795 [Euryarchaeota archaeon]